MISNTPEVMVKMIILGLTGSIGMGKSTTAEMFRQEGIPVHDSDAIVHELYRGEAVALIERAFPETISNQIVDRKKLGKVVIGNNKAMKRLEAIVHPLVKAKREQFLNEVTEAGAKLVVLDIPLLFETNSEKFCDYVLVVTASSEEQSRRVLSRKDMTIEKFEKIKNAQMPDTEKQERADFIIDTSFGIESAHNDVINIIDSLIKSDAIHA